MLRLAGGNCTCSAGSSSIQITDRKNAARILTERYGETVDPGDLWDSEYQAIAEPGTEHEIVEIPVQHLAPHLRFESPTGKDRLRIESGKVDPQQLQSMRVLTPQSAELLKEVLGSELRASGHPRFR